jgi:ribosomal protein S6--L-glutamate ligase
MIRDLRIGFVERPHPPGHRGSVTRDLIPLLREAGARVDLVHAERGLHRLDAAPPWDLVVLKSGSAAALHLAAAAEGWGVPCVNRAEATRLAQDKLASAAILQRAGLPIAPSHLAWLGPAGRGRSLLSEVSHAAARPLIAKAARGSRGVGLWEVHPGGLPALAEEVPEGPYLLMERVPCAGDDLKVFVAGGWMAAIERPFPATTLAAKLGRPVPVGREAAAVAREAGRLLGLTCFGCDFVEGPDGWALVDVNAFPGYKGATEAPLALAAEIARAAEEGA